MVVYCRQGFTKLHRIGLDRQVWLMAMEFPILTKPSGVPWASNWVHSGPVLCLPKLYKSVLMGDYLYINQASMEYGRFLI